MSYNRLNGFVVDIETLATTPNGIIMSIGAVRVDIPAKKIYDPFYVTIDAADSKKHGMIAEPKTIEWWSKQDPAVMRQLRLGAIPLKEAMSKFYDYAYKHKDVSAWAWGSAFDFPCLEWSLRAVGFEQTPWHYRNVKCMRTVSSVLGVDIERDTKNHHNALQDAKDQAQFLIDLFGEDPEDDIPF